MLMQYICLYCTLHVLKYNCLSGGRKQFYWKLPCFSTRWGILTCCRGKYSAVFTRVFNWGCHPRPAVSSRAHALHEPYPNRNRLTQNKCRYYHITLQKLLVFVSLFTRQITCLSIGKWFDLCRPRCFLSSADAISSLVMSTWSLHRRSLVHCEKNNSFPIITRIQVSWPFWRRLNNLHCLLKDTDTYILQQKSDCRSYSDYRRSWCQVRPLCHLNRATNRFTEYGYKL